MCEFKKKVISNEDFAGCSNLLEDFHAKIRKISVFVNKMCVYLKKKKFNSGAFLGSDL